MATLTTSIWNMALAMLGSESRIEDEDSTATHAKLVRNVWDLVRDSFVQGREWQWARGMELLVERPGRADDVNGWEYVYLAPSDMLVPRRIMRGDPRNPAEALTSWEQAIGPDGNREIWTLYPEAWLEYTRYVTNMALMPPMSQIALAARLATFIAIPLRGGSVPQDLTRGALTAELDAWVSDRQAQQADPPALASYLAARGPLEY